MTTELDAKAIRERWGVHGDHFALLGHGTPGLWPNYSAEELALREQLERADNRYRGLALRAAREVLWATESGDLGDILRVWREWGVVVVRAERAWLRVERTLLPQLQWADDNQNRREAA